MWACCTIPVLDDGIFIILSEYWTIFSSFSPTKLKVFILSFFAALRASIIFLLLPDVDSANKKSLSLQRASTCFEKIYSNPKSFPIDVITDVSVVKATPGIGSLFVSNLPTSWERQWIKSIVWKVKGLF